MTQPAAPRQPITFLEFTRKIGVTLTHAQRVLSVIAYDGAQPAWLEGPDREMARTIFGDLDEIPDTCRQVIVALCGARGGKSYVLCALRLLYLALTVSLVSLAPGERASALIVAPKLALARQTFRFALGAARSSPLIANRLSGIKEDSFLISRGNGQYVVVECLAASRGGDAVRARNYVGATLDEFAFFRSEDFQVNDGEIFRAVSPRILPGGQLIIASTAWAAMGMMYGLFSDNFEHPKTCLAARAPTLLLNPSKEVEVGVERERDPINAAREFDCEFMGSGVSAFFAHEAIRASTDESLRQGAKHLWVPNPTNPAIKMPPRGCEVLVGADLGFKKDSSAIVIVYRLLDGTYVVADILELQPRAGEALKPSQVCETFAKLARHHGSTFLTADGWYSETAREELWKHGVSFSEAPAGAQAKAEAHVNLRTLMHQGKVRLPPHRRLLNQLQTLIAKPASGGGLHFSSPRTPMGGHGDILSALVLAVNCKTGQRMAMPDKPVVTREEAIKRQMAEYWAGYENKMQEQRALENEAEGDSMWGSWDGRDG